MMQGESFELDLLQKALRDTASMARRFYDLMFPVEMAEWTFLHSTQSASILELLAFTAAALQAQLAASFRLESFLYIFQNFISAPRRLLRASFLFDFLGFRLRAAKLALDEALSER